MLSHSVMSSCLQPHGLQSTRLLCPWDFPGENTGMGCHFLLQGIFPTQGSNPHLLRLLHCRQILYPLSIKEALKQITNMAKHQKLRKFLATFEHEVYH